MAHARITWAATASALVALAILAIGVADHLLLGPRAGAAAFYAIGAAIGAVAAGLVALVIQTHTAARSATGRLIHAIENLPEALILWDADDRLVLCNAQYRKMSGPLSVYAIPGARFEDLVRLAIGNGLFDLGGLDVEGYVAKRKAEHGIATTVEHRQHNGSWLLIRERRLEDGGIISLYTDVTDQKNAQIAAETIAAALKDKQQQLDVAMNNIGQGIAFFDAEQRLVLSNRRFREFFKLSEDLPSGLSLKELLEAGDRGGNYSDKKQRVVERRMRIAARRERHEAQVGLADGRVLDIVRQPLPDGSAVVTFTDVTERERIARELLNARDTAEAANRAKTRFLARVSHELRTPLNAIIGFSEIIRDRVFGNDVDRYAAYAGDINFSGQHLLQVINDILDMSKIEAGEHGVSDEVVDLGEHIMQARTMLESAAQEKQVRLETRTENQLPAIRGDRRSVLQVLLNLMSNAIKFTPSGGTVTVAALREYNGDILIRIVDTGIGIDSKDQALVFEPFYQVDRGHDRRFEGTGLGLSICKNIMEMHGGTITIQSEIGRGTTVTLRFPSPRVMAA